MLGYGDPTVSILTRSEDRVLPTTARYSFAQISCFNPHPARRPGASVSLCRWHDRSPMFQSSPGPKTGCFRPRTRRPMVLHLVSILTRPEDRVLPRSSRYNVRQISGFNPHPVRRPGASGEQWRRYQSSCDVSILTRPEDRVLQVPETVANRRQAVFQSSPGPKTGCFRQATVMPLMPTIVSILTRPEDRVLPDRIPRPRRFHIVVSILTRPEDRVLQTLPPS